MKVLKPMRDMIVVSKQARPEKTEGGILLPNMLNETSTANGIVLQLGEGANNDKTGEVTEIDLAVGDAVLFHHNSGIRISEKDELPERWLLREEDILAIVI